MIAAAFVGGGETHAYSNSRLMDDAIFDKVGSMTEAQIRAFINSRPTSCLATSGAIFPEPITYWQYGGNVDAARVIYNSAVYNDLNPQVILATLQKEQSLITRTGCHDGSIDVRNKAMGMGCPDGGQCPAPAYAGFHQQIMKGSWTLKFAKERANGNVEWGDNGSIVYGGPWTQGNRKACSTCSDIYRDGYWTIDGQVLKMETGATASLYRYTPHLGQSFPSIFQGWFGSVLVPTYSLTIDSVNVSANLGNMLPGQTATITYNVTNTGTYTWTRDGANPVLLATTNPRDRISPFCHSTWVGCNRPARLTQATVAPGQPGTFTITIKAPNKPGEYREHYWPVVEGVSWFANFSNSMWIRVIPPVWSYSVEGQAAYTDSTKAAPIDMANLSPGQTGWLVLRAKNTGNMTWNKTGANPVMLGTDNPRDLISRFCAPEWAGCNRPADLTENTVAPGATGTFEWPFRVPRGGGEWRQYYTPVAEGITWFNTTGVNFYSRVHAGYSWQLAGQYAYTDASKSTPVNLSNLVPGQRVWVGLLAKNTGTATWFKTGAFPLRLGTTHPLDRTSPFCDTPTWIGCGRTGGPTATSVAPGQTAEFGFWYVAPATKRAYYEYFNPVVDGVAWLPDLGVNFYTVVR
jgi:hypothetical protein